MIPSGGRWTWGAVDPHPLSDDPGGQIDSGLAWVRGPFTVISEFFLRLESFSTDRGRRPPGTRLAFLGKRWGISPAKPPLHRKSTQLASPVEEGRKTIIIRRHAIRKEEGGRRGDEVIPKKSLVGLSREEPRARRIGWDGSLGRRRRKTKKVRRMKKEHTTASTDKARVHRQLAVDGAMGADLGAGVGSAVYSGELESETRQLSVLVGRLRCCNLQE